MSELWLPPDVAYPVGERIIQPGNRTFRNGTFFRDHGPMGWNEPGVLDSRHWATGKREGLQVIVSIDLTPKWGPRYHLSISHRQRYPTWDEIHEARDVWLPAEIDFMMILPRAQDYVNLHSNVFHLHETPEVWGMS